MSAADGDDHSHLFAGVRFSLLGFDPVSESQYRSEIVRRAGADAGGHGADCIHLVVCGLVYDDPVCVAARGNGKKVVTELWVDDSLDLGVTADADRILYRPLRDLNGIPGSESLDICLTGYQKNWREDIMKMVTLMGAQFSNPLIANKVTLLICYKFEGEKYELAKKVKINCVNHQWLEDCLKAWEILPIDNYTKRWILKSDYFTACNAAGKLVEEEPFEWHGHGLLTNYLLIFTPVFPPGWIKAKRREAAARAKWARPRHICSEKQKAARPSPPPVHCNMHSIHDGEAS